MRINVETWMYKHRFMMHMLYLDSAQPETTPEKGATLEKAQPFSEDEITQLREGRFLLQGNIKIFV